ncbi:MAG TPA: phosphoribosyltransferase family protein [Candidatus Paceibacterota bacterium]
MFADREDAGKQLAEKLARYKSEDAVVLALPRGGVAVGYEIAQALKLPFDIVVVRKIGPPGNPEYAVCAVDEKGTRLCNEGEARKVDEKWLAEETERQRQEAVRRIKKYRGNRAPAALQGKTVIIVDDGIATGLTMRLAVAAIKKQRPQKIIVAVPVAPLDAMRELRKEAEVVVLEPPEEFMGAVGAHYKNFPQVEDEEVIRLLNS